MRPTPWRRHLWPLLVLLVACGTAPEPVADVTAARLTPAGLVARDGRTLPLRRWLPTGGAPEALVLAVHGFGGFGLVFKDLGEDLAGQGLGLLALDQRGFGDNPDIGRWPGDDALLGDARDLVRAVLDAYPDTPLYLLGVSMGGAIALNVGSLNMKGIEGYVLAAPAARGEGAEQPLLDGLLAAASAIVPRLGMEVGHTDPRLTADANRLYADDPRVVRRMTVAHYHGILRLADSAYAAAGRIEKPVLLLYGTADPILPPGAVCHLKDKIKAPLRVRVFKGGVHNLLNQAGVEAADPIAGFVRDPTAPLPPDPNTVPIETLCRTKG